MKSNKNIEIELSKLLNTTGLTQKRVLVRKKGGASFWSTRWVQTDKTAKETVEALGYEFIAEGGDEPDIVTPVIDIDALVIEARKAGEAAFKSGLPSLPMDDPKMVNILSDKGIKMPERVKIFESWAKAWHKANLNQPIPGVFDEPEPEPRKPTGVMNVEGWGNVGTVKVGDLKPGDIDVLDGGLERKVIVVKTDVNAPVPSKTVLFAGIGDGPSEVVTLRNNLDVPLKEYIGVDNFDTMPDVEVEIEKPSGRGSQFDRPIYVRDIPLSERIQEKTKMSVPGVGTVPAIAVRDIQIGDKLQLMEGIFTVKDVTDSKGAKVGQAGKSALLIFEETDDTGKNLKLKKQKRTMLGVERSQLRPGGFVPRETDKPKSVPYWGREPGTEPKVLVSAGEDFVPASSLPEAITRLHQKFIKPEEDIISFGGRAGIDLKGLKLDGMNSILNGFERVLGKHGIKLDYIGWNTRKQNVAALYTRLGDHRTIQFQKTATKNIKSRQKNSETNFVVNKEKNIAKYGRHLTYPETRPGDHDRIRRVITRLEACNRWTVDTSLDDMLAGTAAHEANHAIYFVYNLKDEWDRNIRRLVGDKKNVDIKCSSVSEYGMSSMTELFAEVGAAVAFDIEIDPDVKQAYLDTIGSIK